MAKRKAVGFLISEMGLSERQGLSDRRAMARSVQQYRPLPKDDEAAIKRMKELASENRRYGYLRLHAMLRREGLGREPQTHLSALHRAGLAGSHQKRRKLPRRDRVAPQVPERPMQRWSMDFVSDQLADCRRFRVLNIVDDHSRFCPGQIVDVSIPGARVARFLDDLALRVGLPEEIILDNGPEGTSKAMFDWSERTGVRLRFIEPGKPVQNAFVESLQRQVPGRMPEPPLVPIPAATPARKSADGVNHYNTKRPHSALGYLSPTEFLMKTTATALETLAVSALPLNTKTQPEDSSSNWP